MGRGTYSLFNRTHSDTVHYRFALPSGDERLGCSFITSPRLKTTTARENVTCSKCQQSSFFRGISREDKNKRKRARPIARFILSIEKKPATLEAIKEILSPEELEAFQALRQIVHRERDEGKSR